MRSVGLGVCTCWHVSWARLWFTKLHEKNGRVRESSGYEVRVWTNQHSTTHGSCVIVRPSRTRLFKTLPPSSWHWTTSSRSRTCWSSMTSGCGCGGLEMPLRFPCRRACRFPWLSRKKQRERSHGWHVQCLGMNANRSQPTLHFALSKVRNQVQQRATLTLLYESQRGRHSSPGRLLRYAGLRRRPTPRPTPAQEAGSLAPLNRL